VGQKLSFTPTVAAANSIDSGLDALKSPTTAAVTVTFDQALKDACKSYSDFARQENLSANSDCFYKLTSEWRQHKIGLFQVHEYHAGKIVGCDDTEAAVKDRFLNFFDHIGFKKFDLKSTEVITEEVMLLRRNLINLFPNKLLILSTQACVGGTYSIPHFHDDIAAGLNVFGPTTQFIDEAAALSMRFKLSRRNEENGIAIGHAAGDSREGNEGRMSIRKNNFILFKGLKNFSQSFGDPANIGAVHLSPKAESVDNDSRLFIVSFLRLKEWNDNPLHQGTSGS
jgi:hypothetical protein